MIEVHLQLSYDRAARLDIFLGEMREAKARAGHEAEALRLAEYQLELSKAMRAADEEDRRSNPSRLQNQEQ